MYDLEQLRRDEFPLSAETIYFNHASISPLPARVRRAVEESARQLAGNPMAYFHTLMPMFTALPEEIAEFIGASRGEEIVFTNSTSFGVNSFAQAVPWQPGDNVLFCAGEFPSNAYPWMILERRGVVVRQVPAGREGGLTLANLEPLVDGRTRLVTASAVQFFSGHKTDLTAIGAFCAERDILFVVDAIQAIGHMPLDVQEMNIHALATGGQKSILAVPGIGFLYTRAETVQDWQPAYMGPNCVENYIHWLDYDLTLLPGAGRFGMGTPNVSGIVGLAAALSLLKELGTENIDAHMQTLNQAAIACLEDLDYRVITPPEACGPIVTFATGRTGEETDALVEGLAAENIVVVKHLDPAGNPYIRLSFHCYNTVEEVEQFGRVLAGL